MKKRYRFILIVLILSALTASAFYLPRAMMVFSGYCLSEERYLTPQEKIDIAVLKDIISSPIKRVDITDYTLNEVGEKIASKRFISSYQYASLEEFYALNPDCCFFFKEYPYGGVGNRSIPLHKRLQGHLTPPYLYINYVVAFDWQNNNTPVYRWNYYAFTNCGGLYVNPDIEDFFHD